MLIVTEAGAADTTRTVSLLPSGTLRGASPASAGPVRQEDRCLTGIGRRVDPCVDARARRRRDGRHGGKSLAQPRPPFAPADGEGQRQQAPARRSARRAGSRDAIPGCGAPARRPTSEACSRAWFAAHSARACGSSATGDMVSDMPRTGRWGRPEVSSTRRTASARAGPPQSRARWIERRDKWRCRGCRACRGAASRRRAARSRATTGRHK